MTQGQHGLYMELEITLRLMPYTIQTEPGSFSISAPFFLLLSVGVWTLQRWEVGLLQSQMLSGSGNKRVSLRDSDQG